MGRARRLRGLVQRLYGTAMSTRRLIGFAVSAFVFLFCAALPSRAQSPDMTTLQSDVARLKKDMEAVQRDLQEIKNLLRRAGAMPEEFKSIALALGDGPFKGASDARVTLVEFTDYQCPFCARHQRETVPRLLETYIKTGKLKYVVRDFPLESIHPAASKAAEAVHCASEGGKYWEMHERLFANRRALDLDDLVQHAQALGLESSAFRQCLESAKYAPCVRQAQADGERAGVRGTPSFFVGLTDPKSETITAVTTIRGARPFAAFEEAIENLLLAAPK